MVECQLNCIPDSLACQWHQGEWKKYKLDHSRCLITVVQPWKEYVGCYKDLRKEILGNQVFAELFSLMMMMLMMMLKFHEYITLGLLSFTVLKLFVHHVVL